VTRRCVWSSNLVREEAKAQQRAVKYTPTMGCVAPGGKYILYPITTYAYSPHTKFLLPPLLCFCHLPGHTKTSLALSLSKCYCNMHQTSHTDSPWLTEQLCSVRSGASQILHMSELSIHTVNYNAYTRRSSRNSNPSITELDQPQPDCPTTCGVAQQYSSLKEKMCTFQKC
jgi:hypothetical protein